MRGSADLSTCTNVVHSRGWEKLLAELAQAPLPRAFDDLDDIEKLRVLVAHGHVQATIPPSYFDTVQEPATVHLVTVRGYRALNAQPPKGAP